MTYPPSEPQQNDSPAGVPPVPPYGGQPGYAPPAYPPSPYGTPAPSPYGAQHPVQTTPGAPPVAPYGYGAYPARKTNGLAVASMILSIVGFIWVLPFVGSLAGAIMGHISLGQIKRTNEGGRGMALAGVIIGWAGVALIVVGAAFVLFVIAVSGSSSGGYGA